MNLSLPKNDKVARIVILGVSAVVFVTIAMLGRIDLDVNLGFDEHIFAAINSVINSLVAILLVFGLISAKNGNYARHRNIMLAAMVLSFFFILFYICHHLFAGDTKYGGEGAIRYVYYFILITHIFLAGIILPFILFTAYRALIGENERHRKLSKITWPIWFYVAVTGPIIYLMISPYY